METIQFPSSIPFLALIFLTLFPGYVDAYKLLALSIHISVTSPIAAKYPSPPSPVVLFTPVPKIVVIIPDKASIFLIRPPPPIYILLKLSQHIAEAPVIVAAVANPPSPVEEAVPVPHIVVITFVVAAILRTRLPAAALPPIGRYILLNESQHNNCGLSINVDVDNTAPSPENPYVAEPPKIANVVPVTFSNPL